MIIQYVQVLYSLDTCEPDVIYHQLKHGEPIPKKIFEGTYSLVKDVVTVSIPTHYSIVTFKLQVRDADIDCSDNRRRYELDASN